MLKYLVLLLVLLPYLSWGYYVNSCNLNINILKNASAQTSCLEMEDNFCIRKASSILIYGEIINAKPSGRADAGCSQYIGKKYKLILSVENSNLTLKRGDIVKLHETFEKDNQNSMNRFTFFVGIKN